ncbi:MAG: hypothetical protein GC129_07055 [Proteobacteria bacterium]|nr:hypothetical protein [Pseudomonadota bacterium]
MKTSADILQLAMEQAVQAAAQAEYPFGAAIVKEGRIICAEGSGAAENEPDPTAHSEVNAIRKAAKILGTANLSGCTLVSSCEPCHLCFGAMYYAGIRTLVTASSIKQMETIGWKWPEKDLATHPETYKTVNIALTEGLLHNEVMAMYRQHPQARITNNESRVTI